MTAGRHGALARLLRWREFQESRTADAYRQRAVATRQCRDAVEEAEKQRTSVELRRQALFEAGLLDIEALRTTAAWDTRAREELAEREAELRSAEADQEAARSAHVDARSRTRVVQARRTRAATAEHDRQEKTSFDQVADLLAGRRGGAA